MEQSLYKKRSLSINLPTIINGCRQNELSSQQQLYKFCYPDMIKICYRYANDADGAGTIFNNAMLKVFKNIGQYKDEGKLMAWIKTIVVNCSIDFCRIKTVFQQPISDNIQDEISISPHVFDRVSAKEIQLLIKQLPPATAVVFNMYVYEGFTHKQIAEQLGISDGTSKWHLSEGKRLLKIQLEKFSSTETKVNAAG